MKLYLAVVPTRYETYAIADSEERAKRLALTSALKWVNKQFERDGEPPAYKTIKEVDDYLGCNVWEIPLNGAIQEY